MKIKNIELFLQKACLLMMFVIMVPLLFYSTKKSYITDQKFEMNYFLPKDMPQNNPPTLVVTGLTISSFGLFHPLANEFEFNGTIWFEFDPQSLTLETIDKFSFHNGTILKKTLLDTTISPKKLRVSYAISVSIITQLEFRFFPLENHQLFFVLKNNAANPYELEYILLNTNFLIDKQTIRIGEWSIVDTFTDYGYSGTLAEDSDTQSKSNSVPVAAFIMTVHKNQAGFIFTFLLPLMVLFILSILVLSYQDTVTKALSIIGALIAYKFIISSLAPKVSYFTFIDYLYTLTFCTAFFILCLALLDIWKQPNSSTIKWIRIVSIPLFYSMWILIWFLLLFFY